MWVWLHYCKANRSNKLLKSHCKITYFFPLSQLLTNFHSQKIIISPFQQEMSVLAGLTFPSLSSQASNWLTHIWHKLITSSTKAHYSYLLSCANCLFYLEIHHTELRYTWMCLKNLVTLINKL